MSPRRIRYEANGLNVLKLLVSSNISNDDISKWKYSVIEEIVYVKGSEGFMEWNHRNPADKRDVVILNIR